MRFALVSESPRVSAADLETMRQALLSSDARYLCPAWDLSPAEAVTAPSESLAAQQGVVFAFLPDDGTGGVLGYHDRSPSGAPYVRVLVDPSLSAGGDLFAGDYSLLSVAFHEWCEARVDPSVNFWADGPTLPQGNQYALEACDPCEAQTLPITLANGAQGATSNLITPAWFDPGASGPFDLAGACPGAFQLAPGGYMIVRNGSGDTQQIFGANPPPAWRLASKGGRPGARGAR
jgi:hypothetical protein